MTNRCFPLYFFIIFEPDLMECLLLNLLIHTLTLDGLLLMLDISHRVLRDETALDFLYVETIVYRPSVYMLVRS